MRVFLTHNPEDREAYFGRSLPDLESMVDVVANRRDRDVTTSELIGAAAGCEVIIAHRSTPGEPQLFAELQGLVAFLRCAVDVSTVDLEAASEHGVLVANADKSFVPSTAELALGLLIDTARNISSSTCDYRAGQPELQRPGVQLCGRTAGIIGYGSIGAHLAGLLEAIGMEVLVCDPFVETCGSHERVELDELLARSHAVFPLAQADESTENLIGAPELTLMRPGATLVNVSRGELLDEAAVIAALESGQLGAVGLDVGRAPDQRPSPALASRADVVATPHLGGLTPENADAQAASSVEQVRAMLAGEMPPRSLNPERATRLQRWWGR